VNFSVQDWKVCYCFRHKSHIEMVKNKFSRLATMWQESTLFNFLCRIVRSISSICVKLNPNSNTLGV
jgi:hypothetical protein